MFCKNIPGAFRARNTNKSLFDVIFINSYPTPETNGINGRWNNSLIDKEIVPKKYITMVSTKANTNIADINTINIKLVPHLGC